MAGEGERRVVRWYSGVVEDRHSLRVSNITSDRGERTSHRQRKGNNQPPARTLGIRHFSIGSEGSSNVHPCVSFLDL